MGRRSCSNNMVLHCLAIIMVGILICLTACSAENNGNNTITEQICPPTHVAICRCLDGRQGEMICLPDGSGYSECVCNATESPINVTGGSSSQPTAGTQADSSQPPITADSGGGSTPVIDSSVIEPIDAGLPDGASTQDPTSSGGTGGVGTGGTGGAGTGGTGGAAGTGTSDPPTIDTCPPPPADATANAIEAWTLVNEYRLPSGAGCMNHVIELSISAQAHCDYRALNASNPACDAGAHDEVSGCPGFTGTNVQAREIAAGYPRALAYTEVANSYGDNPVAAVPSWIDTVWHRIPLLDPWTTDMGWGGGPNCDVIDIGRGTNSVSDDLIVVYPYDGQIDVPPAFSGWESPAPPPPPSGWPSAYPISIYAQSLSVTEHVVMKDGDPTPLEHLWLDTNSPEVGGLRPYFYNTAFLYGAPFELNTTYRVRIGGTHTGGAFTKEWTFTTGSRRPWGT
jgi:hypothetical protein